MPLRQKHLGAVVDDVQQLLIRHGRQSAPSAKASSKLKPVISLRGITMRGQDPGKAPVACGQYLCKMP